MSRWLCVLLAVSLMACNGDDGTTATADTTVDQDVPAADVLADSGADVVADTGAEDTATQDTGVEDTGAQDTGTPDTGAEDVPLPDTGAQDVGDDASADTCEALLSEHNELFEQYLTCEVVADCSSITLGLLPCPCKTFLNGEAPVSELAGLKATWEGMGCNEDYVCEACPPQFAEADCVEGMCVTLYPSLDTALLQGGSSFGECLGACKRDAIFTGDTIAELEVTGWDGTEYGSNFGTLEPDGAAAVIQVAQDLVGVVLQDVYGCPDCADGGASYVTLVREGTQSTHSYEFGNPPTELGPADTLVTAIVEALTTCEANTYITPQLCMPLSP